MTQQKNLRSLLRKRASRQTMGASFSPDKGREIVTKELEKLVQKQIKKALGSIFGPPGGKGKKGEGSGSSGFSTPFMPGQHQDGKFNQKQMEDMIDQMVASSLVHGKQTSGVLRVLFGLIPSLIGR